LARFLALDWDRSSFHILAADVDKKGVQVDACADWQPDEELSPKTAESLGKKLRDFLKARGIGAGQVLVSVGRDRVVLKEITHPAVSANEEPALVRFQATKDLADAADDVVLDYAALPGGSTSERRALAVIIRRDIQSSFQHLCRAAGLKLVALVPRPFAMAGCLERAQIPISESSNDRAAVVLFGERWAELTIMQGSTLLFSRSMAGGTSLANELRRGLTVFANQPGNNSGPAPRVLFLVGGNGAVSSLQDKLEMPVENLEVFTRNEEAKINGEMSSPQAACLGLLQAWSKKQLPINLANPKEPVAVVDQGKRRKLQVWIAAAVVLIGIWIFGQNLLSRQRARIQGLKEDKEEIETKFKRFEQEKVDLYALKDWEKGAIPWIDELYDLAARFPQEIGFRITKLEIVPLRNKDRFQARMILQGVSPPDKKHLVNRFIESMRDPHLVARIERSQEGSYKIQVDISRQGPRDYQTRLILPYIPPSSQKRVDAGGKNQLAPTSLQQGGEP
jgi:hypothetical protein